MPRMRGPRSSSGTSRDRGEHLLLGRRDQRRQVGGDARSRAARRRRGDSRRRRRRGSRRRRSRSPAGRRIPAPRCRARRGRRGRPRTMRPSADLDVARHQQSVDERGFDSESHRRIAASLGVVRRVGQYQFAANRPCVRPSWSIPSRRDGGDPARPRHEVVRRRHRGRRRLAGDRRRRVPRPRRPLRLRQVDAAAHDRGPRGGDGRARSRSASATSPTWRRGAATSRWSSRPTRSTRT